MSPGSRLATLIFFPHTRLTPTQKIMTEPVRDKLERACSVINGSSSLARRVIVPWNTATGMAENTHPFPMDAVMIMTMIKSKMAFAAKIE